MRLAGLWAALVLASGCGGHGPTTPTGIPALVPRPGPMSIRVSGVVSGPAGQPLAGVTVVPLAQHQLVPPAATDASGRYELELVGANPSPVHLEFTKDGFETAPMTVYVDGTASVAADVRLHRVVRITPGETIEVVAGVGDALCGHDGLERVCRRVRIASEQSGTVILVGDDREPVLIRLVGEPAEGSGSLEILVEQGTVKVIDLLALDLTRSSRRTALLTVRTRFGSDCPPSPLGCFWDY